MSTKIECSNDEICEVQRRSSEIQEKVLLEEFAKDSHPIVRAKAANIINGLGPLRSTILPMNGAVNRIPELVDDHYQLKIRTHSSDRLPDSRQLPLDSFAYS